MVDTIPLHEIINIEEMLEDPEAGRGSKELERESKKKGHKHNIIQLKTIPDGFNFGKVFYLSNWFHKEHSNARCIGILP